MSIANELIEVLNTAKANQIDVKIIELNNGDIACTCTAGGSDTFVAGSLEQLVRRIKMTVEDWAII